MRAPTFFLLVFGLLAGTGSADERIDKLPDHRRKWLLEEVTYIIADNEKEAFLRLESEQERDSFVDAFWRRRDENPSTPENEYREEHYRRLTYVNEFLGRDTFRPGWRTDRGRYYILLGEPRSRQNFEAKDEIYPAELWFYNNPELKSYGLPPFFYLLFFRRHGTGEFQLYDPIGDGPQALLTRVNTVSMDRRDDVERAYNELSFIDPELAKASLSFRTDEGDLAQFQAPAFGTVELMSQIARAPFYGVDTSYAERLDFERGAVESDYMFRFVPSAVMAHVVPGPGGASYLHWVVEIEPQYVAFVKDGETNQLASAFIASIDVETKPPESALVYQDRKESFITLKPSEVASLHLPISYTGMTPVVPGEYVVRVVLRNRACPSRNESECVRSYTLLDREVSIPEPGETPYLGDLILAYQAELRGGQPSYRAYRFDSLEVIPNPAGIYPIGENVVVCVQPGNAPDGGSLRIQLSSADAGGKILADQTVLVRRDEPIVQELAVPAAEGGRYLLSAVLLDARGRELARKRADVTVSPRTTILKPSIRGSMPQIRPELPGLVSMALGEQYLALERIDEAALLFREALTANPKLGAAREHLAAMELQAGNSAAVIQLLEPVYAEVKDRFEILAMLGQAYADAERYAEAVELLEKAILIRRPEPPVLNVLADANYRVGNLARAEELLEQSLALDSEQEAVRQVLEKLKAERARAPGN
jgi:GWxTD domain-containing protein